jgi:hypothetical protein
MSMLRHKRIIANCAWTAGILFWAVPVVWTQTISDLEYIQEKVPW